MKQKVMLINCIVENHIRQTLEVASFATPIESAKFTEFVMETEKLVWETFFGKNMSIDFNLETQTIKLTNNTDNETVITITTDIRKDFEVDVPKLYSVILSYEGEIFKNWIYTNREDAQAKADEIKAEWENHDYGEIHTIDAQDNHPFGKQYANASGYRFSEGCYNDWEYGTVLIMECE